MNAHRLSLRLRLFATSIGLTFLAACSSTPEAPKPLRLPEIGQPIAVKEVWRAATGPGDSYLFHPAVLDEAVFVAAASGVVTRLEEGVVQWHRELGIRLAGGVAVDRELLVLGGLKGEVLALNPASGETLWTASAPAEVVAPAAFAGTSVIVRTGDNRLLALDRKTGARVWVYSRPSVPLSIRNTAAPKVLDQLVFAGFPAGKVMALNATTGNPVWEGTVALPKGTTELERIVDVVAAPVLGAKEICAVAVQGRVACFDLGTGNLLWARDASATAGIVLDAKALYLVDEQGIVQALDRTSGATVWKQEALIHRRLGTPVIRHGYLLFADDEGLFHALSLDDGALRGRLLTDIGIVEAAPAKLGNGAVFQSRSGSVVRVDVD